MSLQKDNRAPLTASQRDARFNALQRIGCIVCRIYLQTWNDCHIHHLQGMKYRSMGRKAHDLDTIGLCPTHHQHGIAQAPSIHGQPESFELAFGTQEFLLDSVNQMIEVM